MVGVGTYALLNSSNWRMSVLQHEGRFDASGLTTTLPKGSPPTAKSKKTLGWGAIVR